MSRYHRASELAAGTVPVELACLKSNRTWSRFTVDIPASTPPDKLEGVAFAEADRVHGEAHWVLFKPRPISLDAEYAQDEPR